jgi:tRNA (mo5U34)-methyltransferase
MDKRDNMTSDESRALVARVAHWHHRFEIYPGVITPGTYNPTDLLKKTQLPADLRGTRVLDIGTSDGFFALQLARRGAQVVAIDYRAKKRPRLPRHGDAQSCSH